MFYWAALFLIGAIVAGVLGFGGIGGAAADVLSALFFLALAMFVLLLIVGVIRRA